MQNNYNHKLEKLINLKLHGELIFKKYKCILYPFRLRKEKKEKVEWKKLYKYKKKLQINHYLDIEVHQRKIHLKYNNHLIHKK